MNFKFQYLINKYKNHQNPRFKDKIQNPAYKKIMKHVGIAIKKGKEIIFDYQDNWITIEIND